MIQLTADSDLELQGGQQLDKVLGHEPVVLRRAELHLAGKPQKIRFELHGALQQGIELLRDGGLQLPGEIVYILPAVCVLRRTGFHHRGVYLHLNVQTGQLTGAVP